jgi:hypothetical protein
MISGSPVVGRVDVMPAALRIFDVIFQRVLLVPTMIWALAIEIERVDVLLLGDDQDAVAVVAILGPHSLADHRRDADDRVLGRLPVDLGEERVRRTDEEAGLVADWRKLAGIAHGEDRDLEGHHVLGDFITDHRRFVADDQLDRLFHEDGIEVQREPDVVGVVGAIEVLGQDVDALVEFDQVGSSIADWWLLSRPSRDVGVLRLRKLLLQRLGLLGLRRVDQRVDRRGGTVDALGTELLAHDLGGLAGRSAEGDLVRLEASRFEDVGKDGGLTGSGEAFESEDLLDG